MQLVLLAGFGNRIWGDTKGFLILAMVQIVTIFYLQIVGVAARLSGLFVEVEITVL